MFRFIVIERKSGSNPKGLGEHDFRAVPRIGEHIEMNDDQGIGQVYEVIAVIHPLDASANAGDIIIRHVSTTTEFRKNL